MWYDNGIMDTSFNTYTQSAPYWLSRLHVSCTKTSLIIMPFYWQSTSFLDSYTIVDGSSFSSCFTWHKVCYITQQVIIMHVIDLTVINDINSLCNQKVMASFENFAIACRHGRLCSTFSLLCLYSSINPFILWSLWRLDTAYTYDYGKAGKSTKVACLCLNSTISGCDLSNVVLLKVLCNL